MVERYPGTGRLFVNADGGGKRPWAGGGFRCPHCQGEIGISAWKEGDTINLKERKGKPGGASDAAPASQKINDPSIKWR